MSRAGLWLALAAVVAAVTARGSVSGATETLVVRVGVAVDRPSVVIAADGPVDAVQPDTGRVVALTGGTWPVMPTAAGLSVAGLDVGPVVRFVAPAGQLRVDSRPYRGAIEVHRAAAGVTAIDELPLEQYLYGVIKGEIDPRWPPEAVKAQAVAARTLAVERIAQAQAGMTGYDLAATTDAQVYLGVRGEDPAATAAVDATRGWLVTYGGRPIFAAYHANSGGHTEDSENVWGTAYPYLRGVPDPYALTAERLSWTATLPLEDVARALARGGVPVGSVDSVEPGRVTPWGRAITVRVRGRDGSVAEVPANRFRLLVGPGVVRSTMFTTSRRGPDAIFTGRGSGHGVGLDQWGARAMAAQGADYQQILHYYYTGVSIEQIY